MITALDVAIAAGVSKTTVSYVFSPDKASLISEKTRLKVLSAADKLGYQPCFLGRSLSAKRSYNVALVLPSRCGHSMSGHILEVFHGIVQSSESSEYNLNIFLGGGRRLNDSLRSHRMDGIIAVGLGADTTLLEHIASFKLPMVVVNRFFPTAEHIGCVRSDMTGWIEHEVAELKKLNCRNVLVLNKPENSDAGCEISHAVKTLAAENNSGDFKLDMITVREDLLQQMCEILQIEPFYDGFIINGSDGILLQQVAAQLDIPPGSFVISNFSVDSRYNSSGRVWCRCGYDIGTQGWNMLLNMLSGKCSGSEVLLPIIPAQRGIRRKSDIEYGFDL